MRLNIEWMAPWRYGRTTGRRGDNNGWTFLYRVGFRPWFFHTYRATGAAGIWVLGLFVHVTRNASTHGIGFSVML